MARVIPAHTNVPRLRASSGGMRVTLKLESQHVRRVTRGRAETQERHHTVAPSEGVLILHPKP